MQFVYLNDYSFKEHATIAFSLKPSFIYVIYLFMLSLFEYGGCNVKHEQVIG